MVNAADMRRYRDSLPTIPTPEVLQQRLVEEVETPEHTQSEPAATVDEEVTIQVHCATEAPALELDEAAVDVEVAVEVPQVPSETPAPDPDSSEPRAGASRQEPLVLIQEASAQTGQPETEESDPSAEFERDCRTCETVLSVRIKVRRRRLVPRLALLTLVMGALAGYWYNPVVYQKGWQELQVKVAQGQRVAQQTWLDGRRSLGF